jgi:diaminopimelate epimerase
MLLKFYKYQGTGNDFILFDNRDNIIDRNNDAWVAKICDRHFGIGADGVMFLENHKDYDFEMIYYNADGKTSSMCGNGGRCMVNFVRMMEPGKNEYRFLAVDGEHLATINKDIVSLKMQNVESVISVDDNWQLNTGSPHYVTFVSGLDKMDVKTQGASIRYSDPFMPAGINVNFLEEKDGKLYIRTYERGVEDETLSCGTGVTAAAICYVVKKQLGTGTHIIDIETMGGSLKVALTVTSDNRFEDIWLIGPGEFVFDGLVAYP